MKKSASVICGIWVIVSLFSCNSDVDPVIAGIDKCDFCNMTIIDNRYSAALLAPNGETSKFDDVKCMMDYSNKFVAGAMEYYVTIYDQPLEPMVRCEDAYFLKNEIFPSPMNSGYAAFLDESKAKSLADSLETTLLRWNDVISNEWNK